MEEKRKTVKQKFFSNKVATFAMAFIVLSFLLSLISYLVIPDNSPNANQQFPTISLKKPGFKTEALLVKKNYLVKDQGLWKILVSGKIQEYEEIVFKEISFGEEEVVLVNHYNRKQLISYPDIYFALDNQKDQKISDGTWQLTPLGTPQTKNTQDSANSTLTIDNSILISKIKEENIISKRFLLGTDTFGRDIFSRLILGVRISIMVGLVAVLISLFVGITMGAIAGYFGGKVDDLIMLIINVSWSIPTLLLVFAIVLAFDRGVSVIFIAVGLTMWVEVARIVRGQVKSLVKEPFIMAAKSMGFRTPKIIIQHILPNILGPVLVIAAANFSTAVLVEAGLSYLGFGVEPPMPSIGNMLNEHYGYALTGKVFLAIVPAITIMLLVLSFNLVGSGLRDAFDVKRQDS